MTKKIKLPNVEKATEQLPPKEKIVEDVVEKFNRAARSAGLVDD